MSLSGEHRRFFNVLLTKIGFLRINPCKQELIILKYILSLTL